MFHLEQNFKDPLKEAPQALLKYTCNGIKLRQHEPITIPTLHKFKAPLQAHRNFNRFDKLLATVGCIHIGLLWLLERGGGGGPGDWHWTSSLHNFNPLRDLSVDDVVISPDYLWFRIKQFKTDQFRQTISHTIPATGTSTCPVRAMTQYLKLRSTHRKTGPLFIWHTYRWQPHLWSTISHTWTPHCCSWYGPLPFQQPCIVSALALLQRQLPWVSQTG